jgi:hypothetical protein
VINARTDSFLRRAGSPAEQPFRLHRSRPAVPRSRGRLCLPATDRRDVSRQTRVKGSQQ